jgi:probable phosphoglycerate mutase
VELILVRHGLPERSDVSSDPPLCAEGLEQARRVGAALAGEKVDAVFASTMRRAIQTAEPYAGAAGHEIRTHEGIVEFDRDSGTYVPLEVLKREDYEAWKAFVQRGQDPSLAAFQQTVVEALESVIAAHRGQTVAVFCHGGVINVWTAHVLGMAPRLFFEPRYASVHRYLCAGSGERNVVSLNDVAHLREG